ncbi:MAG: hypothetical protein ACLSFT_03375 [Ruminococcus callidus]
MKYTIAFPAGLTAAVLLLCTGCAATQVRDRAYLQAIELRSPDTPTVLLHDFHESKAIAYGKGSSVSQAVANAAVPVGKTLFLGHLELIAYENPAFGEQLDDLMQQYRLSPACKVACSADGITLAQEDTTKTVEQLRQAEHAGQLPETDLFTILREWDTASGTALVPLMTEDGFPPPLQPKRTSPLPFLQMRFPDSAGPRGQLSGTVLHRKRQLHCFVCQNTAFRGKTAGRIPRHRRHFPRRRGRF